MSESTRNRKPLWIAIILIVTQLVFVLSIVSKDTIQGSIKQELSYMIDTYGYEQTAHIYEKAVNSTTALTEDSGVLGGLKKLLLPEEYLSSGRVLDEGFFNTIFWRAIEGAIDNLSLNVEYFLLRLYGLTPWVILGVVLLSASIFTGYMLREIKKQGFEYSSPLRHGLARKFIYYTPLVAYLLFMVPIGLPPILFPVLIAVFGLSVALFISNTIKRV